MAALSGMRIEELCRLKVRDCAGGLFKITKAKTTAGVRSVPVHSNLCAIVARRSAGKGSDGYLFDELADPPREARANAPCPPSSVSLAICGR